MLSVENTAVDNYTTVRHRSKGTSSAKSAGGDFIEMESE